MGNVLTQTMIPFHTALERPSPGWCLGTHIAFRNLGTYWAGTEHKTNRYAVVEKHNASSQLGVILWFARWRKYCFYPDPNTLYEETCMREISQFIVEETVARRAAAMKEKQNA